MKKILQLILKFEARAILKKYRPDIIGITGSVGKTSAKEAIYAVLSRKFSVRKNIKNYNNELGLPLSIIGAQAQGKSALGWLSVFAKGLKLILWPAEYPKILILEMGIDKPGDMEYLLSIAAPRIGILTKVGHAHLEFFGSWQNLKKEKESLILKLPAEGWAILNAEDGGTRELSDRIKARLLTYGFAEGQVVASNIAGIRKLENGKRIEPGLHFKMKYGGSAVPAFLPDAFGRPAVEAALIAAAAGIIYGMNLVEISQALKDFRPAPGRMNLLPGIKKSFIIDDSYNSSPESCLAALEEIGSISLARGSKKIAVLGDMLELGSFTEEGHLEVGRQAFASGIQRLVAVGERAREIARGAQEAGLGEDHVFHFPNSNDARIFVQELVKEGDLVFVKGSQGMRMERIVKEIMADPLRAEELLVRQGPDWERRS